MADSRSLHHWLAAGLGSGWLPGMPGTWGSLAALLPGWLLLEQIGVEGLLIATALLLLLGCFNCSVVLPTLADQDPGWIVIDEWVGQWLTIALIAWLGDFSMFHLLLSFIAFRGFDILKPWPIRYVEHLGPPWWSIMADDIVAAIMGSAVAIVLLMLVSGH